MRVATEVTEHQHSLIRKIARKHKSTVGAVVALALKRFLISHHWTQIIRKDLPRDGRWRVRHNNRKGE
jgi:hypothetical protein